ncbi:iron uptake porin [Nostoc sp. B(2019)]|nr:iron uptake porin [Nostoc sp. B(2019)]
MPKNAKTIPFAKLTNVLKAAKVEETVRRQQHISEESSHHPISASFFSDQSNSLTNINAVSELADIQPTDWAFQSFQSLVERYGVITGYPDRTFRGNQAMTRYEFASGLLTTINHINDLILTGTSQQVSQEDLETLKRLQTEFAQELKDLQGRVDKLESRLASTSQQQFSTTTKLQGEVLFALIGIGGGDKADSSGNAIDSNLTFSNRVRLNFDTSFTGKDRLRTRLQATNIAAVDNAAGTEMARLAFQGDSENQVEINVLEYRFPLGEKAIVYLEAVGGDLDEFVANTFNPFLTGSGRGSLSRFAQRNPIYRQGEGAGLGIVYNFSETVNLSLGYIANDVQDPEIGFDETAYGAIAQLSFELSDRFGVGFTYVRSYNNLDESGTGSRRANDPFNGESNAIIANSFGLQSAIALNPNFTLSGWVGFTNATATDLPNDPAANIFNWALTLALVDLGKEGSLGGIAIGQPPKVTNNDFQVASQAYADTDNSMHIEAFYRFPANENIAITPGLLVITNPEHDRNNNTIYIGLIRTTFTF